jgi:hypothetical protein
LFAFKFGFTAGAAAEGAHRGWRPPAPGMNPDAELNPLNQHRVYRKDIGEFVLKDVCWHSESRSPR